MGYSSNILPYEQGHSDRGEIMPENTLVTPFLGSFMTLVFVFSTLYTVAYYFNQGFGQSLNTPGIGDNTPAIGSFATSLIDSLLEGASWLSPFFVVKLLLTEVMSSTPELYTILNLLVLRPVGWIITLFTANFIISKIPTISSEV